MKQIFLLYKDIEEDSIFKIFPEEYWEEIELDVTPVLVEKLKKIKNKYKYVISIPVSPGRYAKRGEIEIPIELNDKFFEIFEKANNDKIKKIEEILFVKSIIKIEKLLKEKND
jgi:hypothetical protein